MTRLRLPLLACLLFTLCVGLAPAQDPPPGVDELADEPMDRVPSLERWHNAIGDSAWVVNDSLWRFRSHDYIWSQKCPPGLSFQECIDEYEATVDTLIGSAPVVPGGGNLDAEYCLTAVDNATVHIPASVIAESEVSAGDTIASHGPNGACVGYRVAEDDGVTLAVVGEQFMVEDGLPLEEQIDFAVYPTGGDAWAAKVEWAACSETTVPDDVCRSNGKYEHGKFLKAASIEPAGAA